MLTTKKTRWLVMVEQATPTGFVTHDFHYSNREAWRKAIANIRESIFTIDNAFTDFLAIDMKG